MSNAYRDEVIESVAAMIERRFDDVNTEAFAYAVRSMKGTKREEYNGTNAYPDEN